MTTHIYKSGIVYSDTKVTKPQLPNKVTQDAYYKTKSFVNDTPVVHAAFKQGYYRDLISLSDKGLNKQIILKQPLYINGRLIKVIVVCGAAIHLYSIREYLSQMEQGKLSTDELLDNVKRDIIDFMRVDVTMFSKIGFISDEGIDVLSPKDLGTFTTGFRIFKRVDTCDFEFVFTSKESGKAVVLGSGSQVLRGLLKSAYVVIRSVRSMDDLYNWVLNSKLDTVSLWFPRLGMFKAALLDPATGFKVQRIDVAKL